MGGIACIRKAVVKRAIIVVCRSSCQVGVVASAGKGGRKGQFGSVSASASCPNGISILRPLLKLLDSDGGLSKDFFVQVADSVVLGIDRRGDTGETQAMAKEAGNGCLTLYAQHVLGRGATLFLLMLKASKWCISVTDLSDSNGPNVGHHAKGRNAHVIGQCSAW